MAQKNEMPSSVMDLDRILTGSPSSALSHPFLVGRVPLLNQTTEKSWHPSSNLSTGGPSKSDSMAQATALGTKPPAFSLSRRDSWTAPLEMCGQARAGAR